MALSLNDQAVNNVLQAAPGVTVTANGTQIPYPFPSPADWRDQWIYFLMVDRFDNPAAAPNPNTFPCNVYQGGKLAGVKQRLQYLKDMGVGAIWLSPVQINPQWFGDYWGGYGIFDFLRIEPRFCMDVPRAVQDEGYADQEFRELVDEAHALGIYVIMDIVLNHVGDLFNYEGAADSRDWNDAREYDIFWREENGTPRGDWMDVGAIQNLPRLTGIWPAEFQRNDYFRRRGSYRDSFIERGDFGRLKELVTEYEVPGTNLFPVRNHLIRACQYLIAKFDIDGFRIDTLMYVETDFARVFGNAMREYALSIGKKNFFTFGEVWVEDDESQIARFVGRNTAEGGDFVGVDAALDFPIFKRVRRFASGDAPPAELAQHYNYRQDVLRKIVSSHGEASSHYVTFLENHDLNGRFHNAGSMGRTRLAVACLMTLQGIPCIYYGMEQGLEGAGNRREFSREALWGARAFDPTHALYQLIRDLNAVRNRQPALKYGRQYFRQTSGNGVDFGFSPFAGDVVAYSRILNDREVLVVANSNPQATITVHVVIDISLNQNNRQWSVDFSTHATPASPGRSSAHGIFRTVQVTLAPMEVQVLV
jgi:glycosidase